MRTLLIALFTVINIAGFAQDKGTIKGQIVDATTNEELIGVNLITNTGVGTVTDIDGNYVLTLPIGEYVLTISYVGYQKLTQIITVTSNEQTLNLTMESADNEFDDVVISGSRYAKNVSEEVISIEVIKPDLADRVNAIRADDLLNKVSGVTITDGQASIRAGSAWSYSVGSRVNIVLDGQSLLTPDRSSVKWQYLPMESIGQFEVLKGASSILYGSSAMNGTIVLSTIKPSTKPLTKLVTYVGVQDDYKNPIYKWWDRPRMTTGGYLTRAHKTSDKFEYVFGLNANYAELPYKNYKDYHIRTNLYTKWNNPDKRSNYGFRFNFTHYQETEFIFWKGPDELALNPIEGIDFKYVNFNIDPYYVKYDKRDNRHEIRSRLYYYEPDNDIRGAYINIDYKFNKTLKKQWNLTVGAGQEFLLAQDDDNFDPPVQTGFKWSTYSQIDKKWNKIALTGGLRMEFFRILDKFGATYGYVRNKSVSGEAAEIPIPLMRMGINYNPRKNTFVRFNIGQAFRLPSLVEYVVDFNFSSAGLDVRGNENLRPEYGWTSELGLKQLWNSKNKIYSGSFDFAFYWQEYKDLIEFQPKVEDGLILTPENLPVARIAGYEVGLKQNVTTKTHAFNLDFGYTYAFPVQLSGPVGSDYKKVKNYLRDFFKFAGKIKNTPEEVQRTALLKYRNRHLVNANLTYENKHLILGFFGRYYSNIENGDFAFDSDAFSVIPGITEYWESKFPQGDFVLDINIGFKFNEKHSLSMNVKNLTNREYSLRLGKIEAPRSFVWSYKMEL